MTIKIARSAVCQHIPFLGNGGKARRSLLRRKKLHRSVSPDGETSTRFCSSLLSLQNPAILRRPHRGTVRPALGSPFNRVVPAALTLPAARWEKRVLATRLRHRFCCELERSINPEAGGCQSPDSRFSECDKIRRKAGPDFVTS